MVSKNSINFFPAENTDYNNTVTMGKSESRNPDSYRDRKSERQKGAWVLTQH